MKGIFRLIAVGAFTVFASSVYAGAGCNYGNLQAEATPQNEQGPLIGRIDDSKVDPKWLALLKEREAVEAGQQSAPIHN